MHSPAFGRARDGCSPIKLSPSFFLPLKQENTAQTWNTSKFVKKKKTHGVNTTLHSLYSTCLWAPAAGVLVSVLRFVEQSRPVPSNVRRFVRTLSRWVVTKLRANFDSASLSTGL